MTRTGRVVIASTRAAGGVYEDRTGPIVVEWLTGRGLTVPSPVVVPDGEAVTEALRTAVAARVDVVITSGGTGISPTDATPESTRAVLDYEIPGLADAIRRSDCPRCPPRSCTAVCAGWPVALWWSICPAHREGSATASRCWPRCSITHWTNSSEVITRDDTHPARRRHRPTDLADRA